MNTPDPTTADLATIDVARQKKARLIMLGIVAVFVLPFFILPLLMSPEQVGKTNKGILIRPHVYITELALTEADKTVITAERLYNKWTLVYVVPAECQDSCTAARNNALYAMRQVRLSLDRSVDRVQQILVFTAEPDINLSGLLQKEFASMRQVYGVEKNLQNILLSRADISAPAGNIYLMSPDGYVFMAYPTFADEKESILRARDIRADLKKSIKGER
jgi:cytochrome oxidase Cu insertion factor (SCO1/SenC/PrrC family)